MTEWRKIPTFPDYEVSECGMVKRIAPARGAKPGKILKPYVREDGYDMFIMRRDGRSIHRKAHQLVVDAFFPERPDGATEIRHIDGTRTNNHWSNLAWGTSKENKTDMIKHGTRIWGEKSPRARFTLEQIISIRARSAVGEMHCKLADEFGVGRSTISKIVLKQRWAFA